CLWIQRDDPGCRQSGGTHSVDEVDRVATTEVYMRWAIGRGQQLLQHGVKIDRPAEQLFSGLGERDVLGEVGMKRPVLVHHDASVPQSARCKCEVAARSVGKSDTLLRGTWRAVIVAPIDLQGDVHGVEGRGATGTRMAGRVDQEIHAEFRAETRQ